MQPVAAARTGFVLDIDNRLDARQMRRQRAAIDVTLPFDVAPWSVLLRLGFVGGLALLDLFQAEQQLLLRQRLGFLSFVDLNTAAGLAKARSRKRLRRRG